MLPIVSQASQFYDSLPTDDSEAYQYLASLVDGSLNEAEWLDFKNGRIASNEKIREIWSKALSGFANSGGGIVIWGIQTKTINHLDVPTNLALAAEPVQMQGLLTTHLRDAVDPPVLGVKIRSIPSAGGEGFVVAYIPQSELKPHRAEVQEIFYIRAGHQHHSASPALLRQLFYPAANPIAEVSLETIGGTPTQGFDIAVRLKNRGLTSIEDLFVAVECEQFFPHFSAGAFFNLVDTDIILNPELRNLTSSERVHPSMSTTICTLRIQQPHVVYVSIFAKDMIPAMWHFQLAPPDQPTGRVVLVGPEPLPGIQ